MKISYFIFLSFLFILMLFSITTYINFKQSEEVRENAEFISRSSTIVRNSSRFQRNILNMVSGLRGYLLSEENYFMQSYDSAAIENDLILKELSLIIPDSSGQKKAFREILFLNHQWLEQFASPLIEAKRQSNLSDSSFAKYNEIYRMKFANGSERKINQRLQQQFKAFTNYEYESRDMRKDLLTSAVQRTRNISFYLTFVSVFIGLVIAILLAYRISTRIVMMVKMADEIAAGNYQVHMSDSGKDELSNLSQSLNNMAKVLAENIALLKSKNEELDQFAHIVSHDLKAPLRGIDNVITWIEEDHKQDVTPKINEYLQIIKGRVSRSENLINGILSYARVGKEEQVKEEVNLNLLLADVIESFSLMPRVLFSIQPDMPILFTEKVLLFQVFSNLITNAVKYNDKDSARIKVYFKDQGDHHEFFVEDNGPGIAKSYHSRIFIIFQTLQERDSIESAGVGLAIVKKIIDARKETIHLISEVGKGTTFSFTWSKN